MAGGGILATKLNLLAASAIAHTGLQEPRAAVPQGKIWRVMRLRARRQEAKGKSGNCRSQLFGYASCSTTSNRGLNQQKEAWQS
jgi:hypothetical protein